MTTQRRMVTTFGLRELGLETIGSGCNVPHAVMGRGVNQEDSLEVNRMAVEFGFGALVVRTTYTKTATSFRAGAGNGQVLGEFFGIAPHGTLGRKDADISALD